MKKTNLTKFGIEKYDPYTWYYIELMSGGTWLVKGNLLNRNENENAFHVELIKKASYGFRDGGGDSKFTTTINNISSMRPATKDEIKSVEETFGISPTTKEKVNALYGKHGGITYLTADKAKELYEKGFEEQKQSFMVDIMYRINTVFGGGFSEVEMNVCGYNEEVVGECVDELKELGYCVEQYDYIVNEDWVIVTLPE